MSMDQIWPQDAVERPVPLAAEETCCQGVVATEKDPGEIDAPDVATDQPPEESPVGCPLCHGDPPWSDHRAMLPRLRRIEGQVRGIQRMIMEKRYCVDILTQISAVQAALRQVSLAILDEHAKGCVGRAVKEGRGEETVDELLAVIKKLI